MTEKKIINILMVDDHPLITDAYREVLSRLQPKNIHFVIDVVHTCDLAWGKITSNCYDILFLDMSFPKEEGDRFISGEDLGVKVKEKYPAIKIIILTQIEDTFHLSNIMDAIKPNGFLLKKETNSVLLANCVQSLMGSIPFFSPKIAKLMHSRITSDFIISKHDRVILHQLSLGTKTKDLHHYLPLSHRTIENRKRKLKEIFGSEDDKSLLANAREQGYI